VSTDPQHADQTVLIAVLSRDNEVLLQQTGDNQRWQPIRLDIAPGSSSLAALLQLRRQSRLAKSARIGRVIGRVTAPPDRRQAAHLASLLYILRVNEATFSANGPSQIRWWPISEVSENQFNFFPNELGNFLEGYVGGWIPDGTITLDS
jgi:hypothetical protein